MCGICGCTELEKGNSVNEHHHGSHLIQVEESILAKNNENALIIQKRLLNKNILPINIMSSPGSGKTTLLARTISDLKDIIDMAVVVGDQQTNYDAQQMQACGAQVVQVNTGKTCHLDAHMLGHALDELVMNNHSILFIENIGNLVCPAMFHLGETLKIVILSVTEGDNKPLKYPDMFQVADLVVITKTDLLPYVPFDIEQCHLNIKQINPKADILNLSSLKNENLSNWYAWLKGQYAAL